MCVCVWGGEVGGREKELASGQTTQLDTSIKSASLLQVLNWSRRVGKARPKN